MAWVIYYPLKTGQLDGADTHAKYPVDFNTDMIRLMMLDGGSAVSKSDTDVTDILAGGSDSEVTGTNYARKEISSVTVSSSAGTVTVDGNDPSVYAQSGSGFNDAKHVILYKGQKSAIASDPSSDASNVLIAYNTFTSSQSNKSGSLTIQFSSASGIFTLA